MSKEIFVNPRPSDRLFFDEFEYCLSFRLPLSSTLRGMKCYNADEIDRRVKIKKSWDIHYERRQTNQYTPALIEQLHQAAKLIFSGPKSRIMCYGSGMSLYSNDLIFLNSLIENDCIGNPRLYKTIIDRPKNSIRLNHSMFSHRTYLKASRPSNNAEKEHLVNLLNNQAGNIRLSPNLAKFINSSTANKYFYRDNFFIDHSNQDIVLLLNLVSPGITRKTLDIILNK